MQKVLGELEQHDLRLRPHFWLADEWFSPENIPGVAIPFYLAHPRLMRGASGRMTATLGAAALVLNQAFTPQIAVQT